MRVDLQTGQITSNSADSGTIEALANDWYRISFTRTLDANLGAFSLAWSLNGQDVSFAGDGSNGIFVWGAQFELGSFPTSLIPTYGATASRSGDSVRVDGTNFSRFFKDTEGTTVVDIQLPKGHEASYNRLFNFSNNSFSDELEMWIAGTSNKVYGKIVSSSSSQGDFKASDVPINSGEIAKLGQTYKTNKHIVYQDGTKGEEDNSVNLSTNLNKLSLGARFNNTSQLGGWIRRLRYFNKQKTDAQVQKLTDTSFLLDKFKEPKQRTVLDHLEMAGITVQ